MTIILIVLFLLGLAIYASGEDEAKWIGTVLVLMVVGYCVSGYAIDGVKAGIALLPSSEQIGNFFGSVYGFLANIVKGLGQLALLLLIFAVLGPIRLFQKISK